MFVSARQRPRLQDQLLAAPYLDPYVQRPALGPGGWAGNVRGGELLALAERIVGERHARRAFEEYAQQPATRLAAGTAAPTARWRSSPSACSPRRSARRPRA